MNEIDLKKKFESLIIQIHSIKGDILDKQMVLDDLRGRLHKVTMELKKCRKGDLCEVCGTKKFMEGTCTNKVTCDDLRLMYNDGKPVLGDKGVNNGN